MRALIEQMLELARTDSAESHLVLRPVDLSGLTARSLLPFEPLFFEQGLTLISQVDEGMHRRAAMRKRCGGCWRFCWTTHKSTPAPAARPR